MTDPTLPPLQPQENPVKAWAKRFFAKYEWLIDKLILSFIGLAIAWAGVKLGAIQDQNKSIEHKADTAAVAATDAKKEATETKGTVLQTQVVAAKTLATETGNEEKQPELVKAKEALAEHRASTREAEQAANRAAPSQSK